MFKKKNPIAKLWLKYTDKVQYKQYKWELKNYRQDELSSFILGTERFTTLEKIMQLAANQGSVNISHSGNAGDIIYALPTIKRIHELTGVSVNLYLRLGKPLVLSGYNSHPMGNVMLNEHMAAMLIALINPQSYIKACEVHTDQQIHIDMDYFRDGNIPLGKGNIARWCSYLTGVSPILYKPWLQAKGDSSYADKIILARSERYRNSTINYKFLSKLPNVLFVGVESEYKDMKKSIPNLQWKQISDFMELAEIIAGCKFFIGNQSFPFSIAEALKVPRILEPTFEVINVVPEGENAYDFFFQEHLESLVHMLNK